MIKMKEMEDNGRKIILGRIIWKLDMMMEFLN
jgi:hypothetical protein